MGDERFVTTHFWGSTDLQSVDPFDSTLMIGFAQPLAAQLRQKLRQFRSRQ